MRLSVTCLKFFASGSLIAASAPLLAQSSQPVAGFVADIIVTAPGGRDYNDDALMVTSTDLARAGHADLLGGLARSLPGLSLSEAQSNPYQPNLVYRGFVASPLQGNAQGLAVYLDGGRFNQPFGDTVNFDLLPEVAIDSVSIRDASPVYGLNALGGAIVVATKTGRTAPGFAISAAGGLYDRATGSVEAGWSDGPYSAYVALEGNHDGGWRRHSPSTLYNGYADLGSDGEHAGIHLKLVGADSDLTGNGSAPVELLAADRRAVFTYPDNTRNQYGRVSLHPWVKLSSTTRIEASLYLQQLRQRTVNGDAADVEGCDDAAGQLCLEDAAGNQNPLIGANGAAVANTLDGAYGVLNRSTTRTTSAGALVQLVDTRALLGGNNELTIGFSHDRSRTSFESATELGALTQDRSVEGLGTIIDQPDGSIAPVSLLARTRYTGVFLSDRLPLLPGLTAEIGVRWNVAEVALDDQLGTALNGRHSFHRVNPGVELAYQIVPAIAVRAGYAETNRAPTPAELSCADPASPCSLTNFFVGDPPLKQVVAKTWEAGASGKFDAGPWQLSWLVSTYRGVNHDDIQFIAADTRGRAYFQNIGQTRRQGVDASLTAKQGPWTVHAGYALTDATFRTALLLNSPDNPSADDDGQIQVRRGDRLPGIPRHRGLVSVDFTGRKFTLGGDVQAQSGQYLSGDDANLQPTTGAFALLNLRGSVAVLGPVSVFGELSNVFDKRYASFGTFSETSQVALAEAPGATNPRSLGPGAPRRWLAGIRTRF
ncbi:TonB-dependent receptor [Polymorphobacter sp. PAMC 29334]|uniref:TonB-dependent receptor n=1 Tax=Polymorphobacter sp. PAMC 29334 TaxID=2862331 RepID=UPI001C77A586|nr:TonB-dependent receptor [Polymorphobacter sp. PAMC 29334]